MGYAEGNTHGFTREEAAFEETVEYNGYDIEYNIYGQGEYTVFFEGEDLWFDTVSEAIKFIDSLEEED